MNNNPLSFVDPTGVESGCTGDKAGAQGCQDPDTLEEQVVTSKSTHDWPTADPPSLIGGGLSIGAAFAGANTAFGTPEALTDIVQRTIPSDGSHDEIDGVEVNAQAYHFGDEFDISRINQPLVFEPGRGDQSLSECRAGLEKWVQAGAGGIGGAAGGGILGGGPGLLTGGDVGIATGLVTGSFSGADAPGWFSALVGGQAGKLSAAYAGQIFLREGATV